MAGSEMILSKYSASHLNHLPSNKVLKEGLQDQTRPDQNMGPGKEGHNLKASFVSISSKYISRPLLKMIKEAALLWHFGPQSLILGFGIEFVRNCCPFSCLKHWPRPALSPL